MKYKMNTTGTVQRLEHVAEQENGVFIRIFYNGKFVNYLFDARDVTNLGLAAIFSTIDPDPELPATRTFYAEA